MSNAGIAANSLLAGGQTTNSPQGGGSWFNRNLNDILGAGSAIAPFPASLGFDFAQAANQGSFNPWFGGAQGKINNDWMSKLGYWTNPGNIFGQIGDLFTGNSNPGGLGANPQGGYGVAPTMASMDPFNSDMPQGPGSLMSPSFTSPMGVDFSALGSAANSLFPGLSSSGNSPAPNYSGLSGGNSGLGSGNWGGPANYYGVSGPSSMQQMGSMGSTADFTDKIALGK